MRKVILHIDMNAYFATVAQIDDPRLLGKPVAVGGSTSRSIISTASYEARKFGVKSAMPIYMAKKMCPKLIIVPPNFPLYEKFTHAFIEIIAKYATKIELASIDECYVDISEEIATQKSKMKYIRNIQSDIYQTLKLQCSIGVAPNKFLAKMASDMKKPMGITVLSKHNMIEKMYHLPIGSMYGVGKKTAKMLNEMGIITVSDFVDYPNKWLLEKKIGKFYYILSNWAVGEDDSEVTTEESDLKSVGNSTTLLHDTNDYDEIKRVIANLSQKVAKRAQADALYGFKVTITIRYEDFKTISRSTTLQEPLNDHESILLNALKLLDNNYNSTKMVRLLGVTLGDVKKREHLYKKISLFESNVNIVKNRAIQQVIDNINRKIGKDKLITLNEMKE